WGRGRVEHLSDSRLEVELVRSLGGAAPASAAAAPTATAPTAAAPTAETPTLDFDTDDDDEPRSIVIRGFGPRWVSPPALPGSAYGSGTEPLTEPTERTS
ncbi:MAG: tRNA ((37)-N6)-threonylcarbamoyltransferase complex ATPase TsaE, partial [Arthrobacter sp.]|nr:tRNA ((37)-N6)-threonylcarbamoyltransferase complex ATPase TsaE [Arthrobacter sp.]